MILIACEESQIVCTAFRRLGYEAYSCDILNPSGKHPEWHIKRNVLEILDNDWDMIIAHPPCTYLTVTGNKWFLPKYKNRFPDREQKRKEAIEFFMRIAKAKCPRIAIENSVGIMSTQWRKPDQYIQPYFFGDPHRKKTGLWLKNLPKLIPTNIVKPKLYTGRTGKIHSEYYINTMPLHPEERRKERSKTFKGFAEAMATQWGHLSILPTNSTENGY